MVPFQPHPSCVNEKIRSAEPLENLAKKRKWEQPSHNSIFDIELHLETPLPFDWQRCLDIQSGKIHFYNTSTQKRTCKDPRDKVDKEEDEDEDEEGREMSSLDLELNLMCESVEKKSNERSEGAGRVSINGMQRYNYKEQQKEMLAGVCVRCHLLVMMCKFSPECPNCKFMNSPDHTSPSIFNRRCHLSW